MKRLVFLFFPISLAACAIDGTEREESHADALDHAQQQQESNASALDHAQPTPHTALQLPGHWYCFPWEVVKCTGVPQVCWCEPAPTPIAR